jgi:predicted lipid-binding transport protein (Tim44 family)
MSYCPRCGDKVEETMAFCPSCGGSLKDPAAIRQPESTQLVKENKKVEGSPEKSNQTKEKSDKSFASYLIGGLVLIVFGSFSALSITGYFTGGQGWAIMLVLIGATVIGGGLYIAMPARKHNPASTNTPPKKSSLKSTLKGLRYRLTGKKQKQSLNQT